MRRPVWQFELTRDTNAPVGLVRETLLDGDNYGRWHPRHRQVSPQITEDGECFEILCIFSGFGVAEEARYRVEPLGGRLLLTYRNRFKGWPVILFMGWWRIVSERVWERFIAYLSSKGA